MSLTDMDLLCYRDLAVSQKPLAEPGVDVELQRTEFSGLSLVLVEKRSISLRPVWERCWNQDTGMESKSRKRWTFCRS